MAKLSMKNGHNYRVPQNAVQQPEQTGTWFWPQEQAVCMAKIGQ